MSRSAGPGIGRLPALLAAVAFPLAVGLEGAGAHECPHHHGLLPSAAAEHAAGADDGEGKTSAADRQGSHHDHEGASGCMCLGSCGCSPVTSSPSPTPRLAAVASEGPSVASSLLSTACHPHHSLYLLPLATAPPLA